MRKHDQGSAAAARDRKGRFSARRKRATVLRLLRGEDLESVSRELGITAARASHWCLRRSLLIRPPLAVRTTMRAAATRPRQFRRPPQTRADGQAAL